MHNNYDIIVPLHIPLAIIIGHNQIEKDETVNLQKGISQWIVLAYPVE